MQKPVYLIVAILAIEIIFYSGCKEDNNDNPLPQIKGYAWAVGQQDDSGYGMILFSDDWGDTWTRQADDFDGIKGIELYDVWPVDENEVWAVGAENSIIKTMNGGQDWSKVQAPGYSGEAPDLFCISITSDHIWVSGDKGIVYGSKDGGSSWTKYDQGFFQDGLMQGICAINTLTVYVVGGVENNRDMRGFIARTNDGGNTWNAIELDDDFNQHEWIGAANSGPENIVIYGMRSHYAYSLDGGASWTNDSLVGGGGGDINKLEMLDHLTWWAAMDYDHITKTLDGGATWADQGSAGPANMFLVGIDCINDQVALAVGESAGWPPGGKILKTTNGGNQWDLKYDTNSSLNKVSYIKY